MIKILTLLLLLLASPAWAALSLVDTTTHDQDALADPINFNAVTTSGVNLLVVMCGISTTTDTVNQITHNSDVLTLGQEEKTTSAAAASYIYYRVNPDIGASLQVSVDLTPGADDGGCVALGFSGANTTTPVSGGASEAVGSSSWDTTSLSINCPSGNTVVSVAQITGIPASAITEDESGQVEIFEGDDGSGAYVMSYRPGQGATTAIGYSWTGLRQVSHSAICVNAAAATARPVAPIFFQ